MAVVCVFSIQDVNMATDLCGIRNAGYRSALFSLWYGALVSYSFNSIVFLANVRPKRAQYEAVSSPIYLMLSQNP